METINDIIVYSLVCEALENAIDNGWPMMNWPAQYIADDLTTYCADFQSYSPTELVLHIEKWKQNRPINPSLQI